MIILLTGAAGAGKSTVGERLARVLNLAFFDLRGSHHTILRLGAVFKPNTSPASIPEISLSQR
ncbi:MAG: shikimate kinase [Gammaproteobacteria bacterium]